MENIGLNTFQVSERIKNKEVNKFNSKEYKSNFKIFIDSFFNFYNLILYGVAIIFILYSLITKDIIPISKYGFLIVVFFNGFISLSSNIKSRNKLKELNLLNKSFYKVIRDNKEVSIDTESIVKDDLIILNGGDLVPCDIKITEGNINVDESILTGESDLISKKIDDTLLSGSSCIYGSIKGIAINVGSKSYINSIKSSLNKIKKKKTPLEKNLNILILFMVCLMIPSFLIVFIKTLSINNFNLSKEVITKSSTIIVGMIPIGMILLSSITLTNSVIKLYSSNILTQDLYSLENLAKIDTLALDKTGTITTNALKVEKIISLSKSYSDELLKTYISSFKDNNKTSNSIIDYLKEVNFLDNIDIKDIHEFSSEYKCSYLSIDSLKYKLGAIEFIGASKNTKEISLKYQSEGKRVILFKNDNEDLALIILSDELSKGIKETIDDFNKMNINIKVISGDNVETVKSIASIVGINSSRYISLENKDEEEVKKCALNYDIFGRATPTQKEIIIKELEKNKNRVCYIGDGINDLLSLKNSTCSISFKSASSASKKISDFILLDNDFCNLNKIIYEGRKVISNIERSCLLFLTKNIFFFFNAIFSLFFKEGLLIDIESIYIFEWISIGLGGVLLSIENNVPKKESNNFIKSILIKSFFSSLFLFLMILPLSIIKNINPDLIGNSFGISTILITLGGLIIIFEIIYPFSKYTLKVFILITTLSIGILLILPPLFLSSSYLYSVTSIKDQIHKLIKGLFNYEIFNEFNLNSLIYLLVVYPSMSIIYLLINRKFKLRDKILK